MLGNIQHMYVCWAIYNICTYVGQYTTYVRTYVGQYTTYVRKSICRGFVLENGNVFTFSGSIHDSRKEVLWRFIAALESLTQ